MRGTQNNVSRPDLQLEKLGYDDDAGPECGF